MSSYAPLEISFTATPERVGPSPGHIKTVISCTRGTAFVDAIEYVPPSKNAPDVSCKTFCPFS